MRKLYAEGAPWETVNQVLDALKAKLECPSENRLALAMEWTPSKLRNYRKGRSRPADGEAMQIAQRLGVDDGMIVAICHAEREPNAQIKAMWLHLAKQSSRFVGPALALAFVALTPAPTSSHGTEARAPSVYSVKSRSRFTRRRRRRHTAAPLPAVYA